MPEARRYRAYLRRDWLTFYVSRIPRPVMVLTAIFVVAAVAALVGLFIGKKLIFANTPSLSYRMFFKMSPAEANRGDYVMFALKNDRFHGNSNLVKVIACAEGDILVVDGTDYYCNDVYLGSAKEFSLKGEKLNRFVYSGVMPEELLFVMGENKDSYDSRYFGFVEKNRVEAKAYPLF